MADAVSADDIVVLSGLEAVRRNPWMYIGSVGDDGPRQLLRELIHNAVDEALAGTCRRIEVVLGKDFCRVEDDGGGIPVDIHPGEGISACEVVFTRLHSGSKFERHAGHFSAGLHGVGLSCVNALSAWLKVEIHRDGRRHVQEFRRGTPTGPLSDGGPSAAHGTRISFWPDTQIFPAFTAFVEDDARRMLEELSFLNPTVEFILARDGGAARSYKTAAGITGLLDKLSGTARPLTPDPIPVKTENPELVCAAVLRWTTDRGVRIWSYVNGVDTVHGGTHVAAFRTGLTRAINRLMTDTGRGGGPDDPTETEEATDGIVAVIDLKVLHPNFEGQTKSRLTNQAVGEPIETAVETQVLDYLRRNPKIAAVVADRIMQVRGDRLAARRAIDKIYFQQAYRDIDEEVYKDQFGARSKNWHDSAVWITHQDLLKAHADLCRQGPEAMVLDVCCGSGVVGASFKDRVKKVIGLDLTPQMVDLARTRLDEVRQGSVYKIPFADATFDLVCTREVLHLLPRPERPVGEIMRVLKPGGQFIVGQILPFSEADAPWMFRVFKKKQPLIYNMFQEEDFRRLLTGAGFVDLEMTEMNVWESIDVWIDSYETTPLHRHEIRRLFRDAPAEVKAAHPFKISPVGEIKDLWRWCVFSVRKPLR